MYKNWRIDLRGWRKWLSLFAADRGTDHKNVSVSFLWELVHWSGRSQAEWLGLGRWCQQCLVKADFVISNLTLETVPSWGLSCPPHSLLACAISFFSGDNLIPWEDHSYESLFWNPSYHRFWLLSLPLIILLALCSQFRCIQHCCGDFCGASSCNFLLLH